MSPGWQVTVCDPIWHVSSHIVRNVCYTFTSTHTHTSSSSLSVHHYSQWCTKALRGPGSTVTWWPSIPSAGPQGLKLEARSAESRGGTSWFLATYLSVFQLFRSGVFVSCVKFFSPDSGAPSSLGPQFTEPPEPPVSTPLTTAMSLVLLTTHRDQLSSFFSIHSCNQWMDRPSEQTLHSVSTNTPFMLQSYSASLVWNKLPLPIHSVHSWFSSNPDYLFAGCQHVPFVT